MKYIALLRGINVGGHRKIKMQDLRKFLETAGFEQVQTYIQSGNLILEKPGLGSKGIAGMIKELIWSSFGFEVPVVALEGNYVTEIISAYPFEAELSEKHFVFLATEVFSRDFERGKTYTNGADEFQLGSHGVYLKIPGKYHQTKLSNAFFEKKLGVETTTRNWKTILKLEELLHFTKD